MRRRKLALFALLLALPAPVPAGPLEDLAKVIRAYVDAPSYFGRFEIEATKAEAGRIRTWKVKGEMAYEAPNKFMLRMEDPIGGFVVACDGERVVSYIWPHQEYRVDPAPKSLKEFKADPLLGLPARGPLVWQFLCAKSPKAVIGDVRAVQEASQGDTMILVATTELKGKKAKAVGRFTFKVDQKDGLIKEIMAEVSLVDDKGQSVAYVVKEKHLRPRLGGKVEGRLFRFRPPKGAQRVAVFSPPLP